MMTITLSTGLGLSFDVQPNDERQLSDTIEHNPEARYLAPVLASALDVLREMKADQDGFADFLRHIVSACDAEPDARVTVSRTQQERIDRDLLRRRLDHLTATEMTLSGTYTGALPPLPDSAYPEGAVDLTLPTAPTAGYLPVVAGPDDLLVISMPEGTTYEHLDEIRAEFRNAYPDHPIAVVRGVQQLAVVKRGSEPDTGDEEFPDDHPYREGDAG